MKLIFPTGRNGLSQSVHASLVGLERLGWDETRLDGMSDPAPRCRPERISVISAAEPLQTAMPPSLEDNPAAPQAALIVDGGLATSAIAASCLGEINVRATAGAGQKRTSITI